jgi:hypothetical protein
MLCFDFCLSSFGVSLVLGLVRLLLWFLELVMTCVDLLMGFKALYAELLCSEVGS